MITRFSKKSERNGGRIMLFGCFSSSVSGRNKGQCHALRNIGDIKLHKILMLEHHNTPEYNPVYRFLNVIKQNI